MPIVVLILLGAAFFAGRHLGRGERFGGPRLRHGDEIEVLPPGSAPQVGARMLTMPPIAPPGTRMPSPNRVLDEVVRQGAFPPPFLVQAALAEAQLAGIEARCQYIVQAFMLPVLAAAQAATNANANPNANANDSAPSSPSESAAEPADGLASPPPTPAAGALADPPLPGLGREQWLAFASALEGEPVDYASDKHVGRYRHNRRRVRELGLDPAALANNAAAQDGALAVDVADACQHVNASGMAADFVGGALAVPADAPGSADDLASPSAGSVGGPMMIIDMQATPTLSGVLAVCCAAGLDGAADWLTKPGDRRRFPNTTAAFWRANGIF